MCVCVCASAIITSKIRNQNCFSLHFGIFFFCFISLLCVRFAAAADDGLCTSVTCIHSTHKHTRAQHSVECVCIHKSIITRFVKDGRVNERMVAYHSQSTSYRSTVGCNSHMCVRCTCDDATHRHHVLSSLSIFCVPPPLSLPEIIICRTERIDGDEDGIVAFALVPPAFFLYCFDFSRISKNHLPTTLASLVARVLVHSFACVCARLDIDVPIVAA